MLQEQILSGRIAGLHPVHLTVQLDQFLIQRERQTVGRIPCEDLGVLVVDQPQVTYSHAALARLMEFDAAVVICGRDHLPAGILLPLADHSQVVWRVQLQVDVPRPLKKQLWKQLVQAKIRAQAANLPTGAARTRLLAIARDVRSGDPENAEGQAARFYWPELFDGKVGSRRRAVGGRRQAVGDGGGEGGECFFRRDPDGTVPNNLLNYGYAVVRAARAIVAAGLLPVNDPRKCRSPRCSGYLRMFSGISRSQETGRDHFFFSRRFGRCW